LIKICILAEHQRLMLIILIPERKGSGELWSKASLGKKQDPVSKIPNTHKKQDW
jgi:hypothetical protein